MALELFALAALTAGQFLFGRGHVDNSQFLGVAVHVAAQALDQRQGIGLVRFDALVKLIPVLWTDDYVMDAQLFELTVQAVAEGPGFITTVNFPGLGELFFGPLHELLRSEFLGGLGSGVIHLADHPVAVGMHVDAQLDAVGFGGGLCLSRVVGIGVWFCFHITLV